MAIRRNRETFSLANDFDVRTNTEVGPDEFTTVEEFNVEKGETVELGQGRSSNLLQAEGNAAGDIQSGSPSDIDGKFRFVVLNSQNNVVQPITQGTIDELEVTRSNNLDGYILPRTGIEIADPYKLGLQLKTNSGTQTYSRSNSNLDVKGVRGEEMG